MGGRAAAVISTTPSSSQEKAGTDVRMYEAFESQTGRAPPNEKKRSTTRARRSRDDAECQATRATAARSSYGAGTAERWTVRRPASCPSSSPSPSSSSSRSSSPASSPSYISHLPPPPPPSSVLLPSSDPCVSSRPLVSSAFPLPWLRCGPCNTPSPPSRRHRPQESLVFSPDTQRCRTPGSARRGSSTARTRTMVEILVSRPRVWPVRTLAR